MMMWEWCTGFGWIWMLIIWVVIIGGLVWAVTQFSARNGTPGRDGSSDASSILDDRFARGKIDDEEYRRIRGELST